MDIKSRLFCLAIAMVVFVIAYSIGAYTDISREEAERMRQQFNEHEMENIDRNLIFVNNLKLSLEMFIPGIGIAFGIFSGFSTGVTSNAIAETSALLSSNSTLLNLIKPFGLMEVFAYGLSMSRSGIIIYQIIKRNKWKEYVIPTAVEIGIVIAVLFIAATIEWNTIISQMDSKH
ncbi:MAG: stage II sporulation protein M [Nitrososphaeraceae archaeon]|nr:stage II sporulation protein M [Nitrososphaeraceae archaeon]